MTNLPSTQTLLESVWTIPSIFEGLHECNPSWNVYSSKCEPFWHDASTLNSCSHVYVASRGITLACEEGKPAVVFVPNRQLTAAIKYASSVTLQAPLVLVVEDHPILAPQLRPREVAKRAGLCVVEPCTPSEVKYCAASAVKLSSSTSAPVVLITHHSLLGASATLDRSERDQSHISRMASESISPIRLGRKLELNRQRTLPSPGEKISVGFVTVGMSDSALRYLVSELQLLGRVPMLNIRLIHPLDIVPVERMLSRCRHVVVLEPRPGEVESEIISISQSMLREGREVAAIWGKELPALDPELDPVKVPTDSLHPSIVARLTQHLLHDAKPSAHVSAQLIQPLPDLHISSTRRTSFGTSAALQLLRDSSLRVLDGMKSTHSFVIDGEHYGDSIDELVYIETWGESTFIADGADVVRDAREKQQTRILLVWRSDETGNTLSMIIDSLAFAKGDGQNNVVEVSLDNGEDLDLAIENASKRKAVSIIIVRDGAEPQFDVEKLAESARDIDRRGFRPQHAIVIPIEQMAAVRIEPIEPWLPRAGTPAMPLESTISARWLKPQYRRWRISLRPILERVEVTRSKPPVRVVAKTMQRLTPPQPIHALASNWRVHIAGYRGDQPGVVGKVLMEAGSQMGYEICSQSNNIFVGAGRKAWSQILFTRKQSKESFRPLVAAIPWGEADVLLGWDREEVLRCLDPNGPLQIGSPERTHVMVNTDPLERQGPLIDVEGVPAIIDIGTIGKTCKTDTAVLKSFASLARYRFHNERLGDLIQLGMAFQLGFIPVTVDAMNVAIAKIEQEGYSRSSEAFDFGRRVALDPESAWQPIKEEFQVDLSRLIKRSVRDCYKLGKRGIAKAEIMQRLIRQSKQSLPGLMESQEGRQAMVDLVNGIRRCMLWGGEETASKFMNSLCKLYEVDRPETGRQLTRKAILPLAEAMLIREPIYLARLARSPEILRRIKNRLNVRHSRGDILKRRFLSRFRLRLWSWSLQIDMRTSDWSSVLVTWIGALVPKHWRGHRRDRGVREAILHALSQATLESENYYQWVDRFEKLHQLALNDTLQNISLVELKKILRG
ncbi:MAG: hypothetical protein H8E83_04065 [Planctomycetes bacterium]|nr:hypothetical protein [Planctomycetota bacterium]